MPESVDGSMPANLQGKRIVWVGNPETVLASVNTYPELFAGEYRASSSLSKEVLKA